jgi:HD-like signal output (HDOD) protein
MSPNISVYQLEPGMVPATDLRSVNGRLLGVRGTPLSRAQIRALKTWGVSSVTLLDNPDQEALSEELPELKTDSSAGHDPETLEQAEKLILPRFAHCDLEHPGMKEIFNLARLRMAEELNRDPNLLLASPQKKQTRIHGDILFGKNQPQPESMDYQSLDPEAMGLLPLPNVSLNLQKALIDPKCTAAALTELINQDPKLCARLLKLINSSMYALPFRVESIYQAMTILGSRQLSMLVLGLTVRSMFRQIAPPSMEIKQFWKHSMACAIAARTIGAGLGGINPERLFLAGLLHDVGWIILMDKFPGHTRRAQKLARLEKKTRHRAEEDVLGINHAGLGGVLLAKLKFSLILEHSVRYHHTPALSVHPSESGIVHIADILVHACCINKISNEQVPPLDNDTWDRLSLDPAVLDLSLRHIDLFLLGKSDVKSSKS